MNDSQPRPEKRATGSGLTTWRRLQLYIHNPRDAFAITSVEERRGDAVLAFVLYFAVKLPVLLQRSAALGHKTPSGPDYAFAVGLGLLGGVVANLIWIGVAGLLLHLVVDKTLGGRGSVAEARRLLALCLAAQLIMVAELPTLVLGFREYSTFLVFTVLRNVANVLSARTFYWGLRILFNISARAALAVTVVPIVVLLLVFLPYILAPLK